MLCDTAIITRPSKANTNRTNTPQPPEIKDPNQRTCCTSLLLALANVIFRNKTGVSNVNASISSVPTAQTFPFLASSAASASASHGASTTGTVELAVREDALPPDLLGRTLDAPLIREIERLGADACGENGEYHTVLVDGPDFARPLRLVAGPAGVHHTGEGPLRVATLDLILG